MQIGIKIDFNQSFNIILSLTEDFLVEPCLSCKSSSVFRRPLN